MVVVEMADEYEARYRKLSHDELYRMLRAGSPTQVDVVADTWQTVESSLAAVVTALRRDLAALSAFWVGKGSREFQYRVGLIATYAQTLASEAAALHTGMSVMSGTLAQAQRQAEPGQGEPTEWGIGGVLGTDLGHIAAEGERASAHERIVALVAGLAAEYAMADHRNWPATVPAPPPDLPGMPVLVDSPAGLAAVGQSPAGEAGASVAAGIPAVAPGPRHTVTQQASTLSGAGAGLAGAAGHVVGSVARSDNTPDTGQGLSQSPASMMGPGIAARPSEDTESNDSRLTDGSMSWSTQETMDWSDDGDPPPSIIGDSSTPA